MPYLPLTVKLRTQRAFRTEVDARTACPATHCPAAAWATVGERSVARCGT